MSDPEQLQPQSEARAQEPDEIQESLGEPKEKAPTIAELADERLVNQLFNSRDEIEDKLDAGEIDQARFDALKNQLDALSQELVGLTISESYKGIEKIIEQSQAVYDFFDLEVNLKAEFRAGNINLLTRKEQREAERHGYTESLIVPDHLRDQVIQAVQEKFKKTFDSGGLYNYAEADIKITDPAKAQTTQSSKYHQIRLKPDQEVKNAHPETMKQSVKDLLQHLKEENAKPENQDFQRRGLNLPEYLLLQTKYYLQEQQVGHLQNPQAVARLMDNGELNWTWLLEEVVRDPNNQQPTRCLGAGWDPDPRLVLVGSNDVSDAYSRRGARFAVVPK